ncbi:E3 ubiquitin/ISG15 ligase TRIM25 isoform X1 [Strigops habroptila]|uniref:E3 ubiquitin/ISG15 ligase TRIM25 isoform X1 n=1 Tax=Strigops habroptila TaxID=2489341 RepID=UPI0011CEEEF7|nr:E3 ubiquitin/ISG15 ligase TRIM25 isoform X1 [Strigops habroptila]
MAEPRVSALEKEPACGMCFSLFGCPLTLPCGHYFCIYCLEVVWAQMSKKFCCPACKATFEGYSQLRKNTAPCPVLEQHQDCTGPEEEEEEEEEEVSTVRCDSCLQGPAVRTCLTCTASFCAEHLRPHQDSPAFRDHQLCTPLHDLQQRKCPHHKKLFEFFCSEHGSCICSLCLLGHKLCHTSPLELAKANTEAALKKRLTELHNQNEKAAQAMNTLKTNQGYAAETISRKKDLILSEFSEIKALIEEREIQILKIVADEEKRVSNKFDYIYGVLESKKNQTQSLSDRIEMVLTEADDILFLKRATALQQISTKDAFVPVVEIDQNLLHSSYQSAINLKDTVKLSMTPSKEKKVEAEVTPWRNKAPPNKNIKKPLGPQHTYKEKIPQQTQAASPVEADTKEKKKPAKVAPGIGIPSAPAAVPVKELLDIFLKKPREEFLQYAADITLDYNTAHNKVILSDRYTKMSVSDTPLKYNEHPRRFTDCYQVLGVQCFKRGIHYWEVEMQQNNFCGIGICYGSMERHGPESRLGRNSSSWCIEWFNSKISSWHNDVEKCLPSTKATKIGVLLHCEAGFVIFTAVGEKHNLIYKYKIKFTEAVYPAFWLFSSGTILTLCQMKE